MSEVEEQGGTTGLGAPAGQTGVPPGGAGGPGAGSESVSTGTQDWRLRYENLQPEFTRATQDRDRYRQEADELRTVVEDLNSDDPAAQARAAEFLGIEFEEISPGEGLPGAGEPGDPIVQRLMQRIDALENRHQAQDASQEEQAAYSQYRLHANQELQRMGVPTGLHDIVADTALAMAETTNERPDLGAAFKQIEQMAEAFAEIPAVQNVVKQRWADTKRTPQFQVAGQEGTGVPNLDEMSKGERHQYMAQRLMDLNEA